jgi:nitroreductase
MDAMEAILTRRSVRQYTEGSIPADTVQSLLEAAMSAPSAGNQQPWQYVVIDDRNILDSIPKVHPYSGMLKQAPLAIVVCGDMEREKYKGDYWVQDCSAATQNLLIAARALGLGAVWLGVYPLEDRIRGLTKLLNLPEHIIPLAVISIGHPASEQGRVNRYDMKRIHKNKWEG